MSKYTVLMVDDEENVIRAMQKKIDWESIGFRIMGYAHNGIEALDLAEQEAPDVVLTDIKMPYMDGLELAHNLKIMYPTVRILIFSGFDEFEYAKEAIRLEVEEYILKPVDADELRRIFMRIKESLDQEMDEKRNVQKLRDYYMESTTWRAFPCCRRISTPLWWTGVFPMQISRVIWRIIRSVWTAPCIRLW